jgi:hypothetical protein
VRALLVRPVSGEAFVGLTAEDERVRRAQLLDSILFGLEFGVELVLHVVHHRIRGHLR